MEKVHVMTTKLRLSISQHNDKRYYFTLVDEFGTFVDPDDFTEMTFIVSRNVLSAAIITKKLSRSEVVKSGANEVYTDVFSVESGLLPPGTLYCELSGTSLGGAYQTLGAGPFRVADTQIRDT